MIEKLILKEKIIRRISILLCSLGGSGGAAGGAGPVPERGEPRVVYSGMLVMGVVRGGGDKANRTEEFVHVHQLAIGVDVHNK